MSGMKKISFLVMIPAMIGLAAMWLCYQVFHLEQTTTTIVAIIATIATYHVGIEKLARQQQE